MYCRQLSKKLFDPELMYQPIKMPPRSQIWQIDNTKPQQIAPPPKNTEKIDKNIAPVSVANNIPTNEKREEKVLPQENKIVVQNEKQILSKKDAMIEAKTNKEEVVSENQIDIVIVKND